jgi:hypothetical protein
MINDDEDEFDRQYTNIWEDIENVLMTNVLVVAVVEYYQMLIDKIKRIL